MGRSGTNRAPLRRPHGLPDPRPLSPHRAAAEHRPAGRAELGFPVAVAPPHRARGPGSPGLTQRSCSRTRRTQAPGPAISAPTGGGLAAGQPASSRPGAVGAALGTRTHRRPARTTSAPQGKPASHPRPWSRRRGGDAPSTARAQRTRPRSRLKGPRAAPRPSAPEPRACGCSLAPQGQGRRPRVRGRPCPLL